MIDFSLDLSAPKRPLILHLGGGWRIDTLAPAFAVLWRPGTQTKKCWHLYRFQVRAFRFLAGRNN